MVTNNTLISNRIIKNLTYLNQLRVPSTSRYQSSWDSDESYTNRAQPPHFRDQIRKPYESNVKKPIKRFIKQDRNPPSQLPTEKELAKRVEMRIKRAERLERKDLTAQLTETKTYMGGFTQPRHLAFLNTLDKTRKQKDSYEVRVGSNRVRPSQEAYEPHVVYLAVTRYPIKWPQGRATRRECFSGFCAESELADRFRSLNYGNKDLYFKEPEELIEQEQEEGKPIPTLWNCLHASKEYIDLAVWPDSPEARSITNRKYYSTKKNNDKVLAAVEKAKAAGEVIEPEDIILTPLPTFLPPVVDWIRPSPPFLDHRLVVPFFTITLPTRPLAATLARLCNAFPRGLPFYASVPNQDRKDGPDFFRRLLRMRTNRIQELTETIVSKLDGIGGGLFGLRLNSEDKGRGVEGEALSEELRKPEGGWAEIKWLREDSEVWEGIEQEVFVDGWNNLDGVRKGTCWDETGVPVNQIGVGKTEKDKVLNIIPEPVKVNETDRASL